MSCPKATSQHIGTEEEKKFVRLRTSLYKIRMTLPLAHRSQRTFRYSAVSESVQQAVCQVNPDGGAAGTPVTQDRLTVVQGQTGIKKERRKK